MTKLTIEQAFELASQHHSAGRLREAESIYQQILKHEPRRADALHRLGIIAHQEAHHAVAIDLIQRAIALNPDSPEYHNNLGTALRSNGQLDEAIDAYRTAIARRPAYVAALNNLALALWGKAELLEAIELFRLVIAGNPTSSDAHNNLGRALRENGQIEEAIATYRQAIILNSDDADSHSNLGNALRDRGQLVEAIAEFRRAIAIRPEFAEAFNNLGNALTDKEEFEEGALAYTRAVELRPTSAEAHHNLGNALRRAGKLEEAIASYRRAIKHRPYWSAPALKLGQLFREHGQFEAARSAFAQSAENDPADHLAQNYLATVLAELQRFDEASLALDRAAALAPDSILTHETRGILLLRSGRGVEAVKSFRRVVEMAPDSTEGWNNLGEALRQIGRFDESADCALRMSASQTGSVRAYTLMAGLGSAADARARERLTAAFEDPKTSIQERASLGFVLGKMLDQTAQFDDAFSFYAEANALTLQMRHAAGARYSSDRFARRVDDTIALFTRDFFTRSTGWGEPSELPVFIVGMPRSGTSLVEQIASSHPDVFGAGELMDIDNLATSLASAELRADQIKQIARNQLDRLHALTRSAGTSATRVIDKMPSNVERLGLIATLFPRARVIICRRNPLDTCLSCFFQPFTSGNLFSLDLQQCGLHHVLTDRLIAHWLDVRPIAILEVKYEALVADLEGQSRRMINFLGLPWDRACVDFHRTERTVQTASDWQVRQPIYTRSVGRWRNYARHLSPLRESLGLNQ